MMEQNSEHIKRAWAIAEKRQFCKQSCTKISQGLDKLDPRSGERAIWELLQNARDLSKKNTTGNKEAHIKIALTSKEFIFAHQGKPFTHDTFSSLVKQVSSQTKEDEDSVGQYGTGFLTTHAFGRQIFVSGSLDMEEQVPGKYVSIDKFNIDRTFESIPEFVEKMAGQLCKIDDLADAPKLDDCKEWTEFFYQLHTADNAIEKAKCALNTAMSIMPYVMTINEPIGDITLSNEIDGKMIRFTKEQLPDENGLKVMGIHIHGNDEVSLKKVYYLQSQDGDDTIILPLCDAYTAESLDGIAKLFVFFPLLGTEDFGMDFIFHSHRFYPVEERDGIWLPVENANVRNKYERNVEVLYEMTDMLFDYLNGHINDISNWYAISALKFETIRNKEDITNDFFLKFKSKWVDFLQKLPIIPSNSTKVSADSNIKVLNAQIVDALEYQYSDSLNDVYDAASIAYNLPNRAEILTWSKILAGWYNTDNNIFLDCESLAKGIANTENNISLQVLHRFDTFLKNINSNVFKEYALIPNREGKLMIRSQIYNASDIPSWLYKIAKELIIEDTSRFVDMAFEDIGDFTPFSRNDLSKSINDHLSQLRKDYLDKGLCYDNAILCSLAKLSLIFKSGTPQTIRSATMSVICEHLGIECATMVLPSLDSSERDISLLPFKHLVENMLLEISKKDRAWIVDNEKYVYSLHDALHTWSEYFDRNNPEKEGFAAKYGAFPNAYNIPCRANELKQGVDIPNELFDMYQSVFGKDLRVELVNDSYLSFFNFPILQAKDVAKAVEEKLAEGKFENDIILDIIKNIEDTQWSCWFPRIAEKKAELFMKQVEPDCKDGIFQLMKIDDPNMLNQLAELASDGNFDEIVRRGKEALNNEKNAEADFEYKKRLGEYVEYYIQKELEQQLGIQVSSNSIRVENEQYGHDLVIYNNETPIYYIEIKSRWSSDQSVMMSPLQLRTSVENKNEYALCCVDMIGVSYDDVDTHTYPPFEETISRIKVLDNIGLLNESINSAIQQLKTDEIHIDGDFRCVIPQRVIEENKVNFKLLIKRITAMITSNKSILNV